MQNANEQPAPPRLQVPATFQSAIAKIVSQCLDLLDFRFDRCPPSSCSCAVAPGKDEEEDEAAKVNTCSTSSGSRHNGSSTHHVCQRHGVQAALATDATTAQGPVKSNEHEVPMKLKPTLADHQRSAMLTDDHIPLLLDLPHCVSGDTDLERQRSYLSAKKLAFEQYKWTHEKELQEQEMEVLRSEMEIREVCAQKEIEYQQMSIRADVIYRMILAGASVEDTAVRLAWL